MRGKNIIPLAQYSYPEEKITKKILKETNNKFYKKINTLKTGVIKIRKLSPIKKLQKNYSLPKLNVFLKKYNSNIKIEPSILKEKEKENPKYKGKERSISSRSKIFDKFMTFEEKMILNYYENAISRRMKAKPKRINDYFLNQYKFNFKKSKENYRKIDERKLNEENNIYKKLIKSYSNNYANFSNKILDKSWYGLRKKFKLKLV